MIAVYFENGGVENYYDSIEELEDNGFEVIYVGHESLYNGIRDNQHYIIEMLDEENEA